MKKIDTGNSSFEKLIMNENLYVDKTNFLYNLITDGGTYYFCSRPRRFGKTLMLSTLEAIFKGKKELFKGLYIDSTDYDWEKYPVIHLDFSLLDTSSAKLLKKDLANRMISIAEKYGITVKDSGSPKAVYLKVISELAEINKVVILIDEYDNPLSRNIQSSKLQVIRDAIRDFFDVVKGSSPYLRFCLITGITRFSKVSIFSAMNNLTDISMKDEYATAFGYTQDELEKNFSAYIDKAVSENGSITGDEYLSQVKNWYNGYRFSPKSETVYNPVSIGSFFENGGNLFINYWINTGGMTSLLVDVARHVKFDFNTDEELSVSLNKIMTVDIIQMAQTEISKENFIALLYQSGYLTIKNAMPIGGSYLLSFGYPDKEVEQGLTEILLPVYLGSAAKKFASFNILKFFYLGEIAKAIEIFEDIFASISYHELVFNAENAWHASMSSMLRLMGADIVDERTTSIGRIDCVLRCPEKIYIIEYKFNQSAEDAIRQIKENRYFEPYLSSKEEVHLLGINFSTSKRNIIEWKDERFPSCD